jgi:hypothetical protein
MLDAVAVRDTSSRVRGRWFAARAWPLVLAAAGGALGVVGACGPSPQRLHCLDTCEQNNGACIAQASTGPALQECTAWTSSCVAACPP